MLMFSLCKDVVNSPQSVCKRKAFPISFSLTTQIDNIASSSLCRLYHYTVQENLSCCVSLQIM